MHKSGSGHQAAEQLTVASRTVRDVLVVELAGEIDIVTADQMQEAVLEAVEAATRLVVVDLTGVSFLGSTGLAALAEGHARAQDGHKWLRIVSGSNNHAVRRPIELTGLDRVFAMFEQLDAAISAELDPPSA
ncbi:STAS domain-containing protein [Actinophytocola sp.]|uniref:STAS domain-containing protein n=1 Tax=Actinophytocola sp. TaxID=1872138 RepID=UPI002D800F11|nr:STAS domain-containing protein [Actinophytocola sp.]HET9143314.1 STAS domain-containing protein [Actinophytocola sp.]